MLLQGAAAGIKNPFSRHNIKELKGGSVMFELTPFSYGNRFLGSYDPFRAFDELERSFFGRQLPTFRTDVREIENAYLLEAELPGFNREDIKAEIKDGYLTIHAEHKSDTDRKDENNNYIRKERTYGSYTRRFDLSGIKSDGISASYKDGILTLTLPKEEVKVDTGRTLEIK